MGRGRLYFTFITVLTFGAFLLLKHFASSKEFHREVACFKDVVRLNCGNHSFIAIHEAYFTGVQEENLTCTFPALEHEYIEDESATEAGNLSGCYEDIRVYVNRKCSGLKECRFSYEDEPEKICPNLGGVFVVRYDCVRDTSLISYCNEKVSAREGYIASPGFPRFYPQISNCSWKLEASEGQTIFAKILHLHLRPATEVVPTVADPDLYAMGILGQLTEHVTRCDDDSLTLLEGNIKRAIVCGEDIQSLKTVEAEASNGLQIKFKSAAFLPASGFLVYFKIEGCPTLSAPKGSYLLERNGSAAVYACSNNQVFNDTQESTRFLSCVRDHHWNDTLPQCTPLEETTTIIMSTTSNKSTESETEINVTIANTEPPIATEIFQKDAAYLEDIIIPCILIGVLVIGNAIIVAIILAIRRKQRAKMREDDENLSEPKSQPLVAEIKDV